MKEIIKIIKKYIFYIILVVILLVVQAQCDLALPQFMSNILNVGLQQQGIDYPIYEVASEETLNQVIAISKNYDFLNNYELINKDDKNYVDKYPVLKEKNIYILKNKVNEEEYKDIKIAEIIYDQMKNNNASFSVTGNNTNAISNIDDSLINQYAINAVINELKSVGVNIKDYQMKYLLKTGIKMLLFTLLIVAIIIASTYISGLASSSFGRDLRSKIVKRIMSYSNKEYNEFSTSSLITRSTNDVQQIQMMFSMFLRMLLYAPIVGIGALIKVLNISMAWVIGLGVLSVTVLVLILMLVALPKFKIVQSLIDKINLIVREILNGLPVIRAFANEEHEIKRFSEANSRLMKVNLFTQRVMAFMHPCMMLIMNGLTILIYWLGANYVNEGIIQVGTIIVLVTYTMQIIMSFLMISMVSIMAPRSIISIKRICEILNKKSSIEEVENPLKQIDEKRGEIEFKDVSFKYPDGDALVLENISFKINKGETLAIIGSTGSGKSSIINLLLRFFDVTSGCVSIGGVDVKKQSLEDLREKVSLIPQKGYLFSGTIESNIKFSNLKMSDEEMIKAATVACADEFILEKELKYQEPISQGGTNVSGGQRQRLSIARALASNPDIILFDDSFSALDYKTDARVRKNLSEQYKDVTKVIVAQRVSTVMNADLIIVLDQGKCVGAGTHKELYKNSKVYREIALSQLREEELM